MLNAEGEDVELEKRVEKEGRPRGECCYKKRPNKKSKSGGGEDEEGTDGEGTK